MLPAGERTDPLADLGGHHVQQTIPRGIAEDGALHVGGLELAAGHKQLAVGVDDGLRNVDRVVVVFGKAQGDNDAVLGRARLDPPHLVRVHGERVLDVFGGQDGVDGSMPGTSHD